MPPPGDLRLPDHPADPHRRGTVKVARLATESGLFPAFEAEAGEVTSSTPIRHQVPVTDYLRIQASAAAGHRPHPGAADRNIRGSGWPPLVPNGPRLLLPGKE